MELTATPDTEKKPSNVLHSVSAAELKAEHMIKLPIRLETEPNWQQCLADAIARRDELQKLADAERRGGASYLRPVVLIQAEARRQGVETLDLERVRQELTGNHRIPHAEIAIGSSQIFTAACRMMRSSPWNTKATAGGKPRMTDKSAICGRNCRKDASGL